ncbi:hypothetical protein, partial [Thiolapillus sp.]
MTSREGENAGAAESISCALHTRHTTARDDGSTAMQECASALHPWRCAAPVHDLHGWRKYWNCMEQFQCPDLSRHTTARDGGSAGNAGVCQCTPSLEMRRSCASLRPRHTVHPVHKKTGILAIRTPVFRQRPF